MTDQVLEELREIVSVTRGLDHASWLDTATAACWLSRWPRPGPSSWPVIPGPAQ